MRLNKEWHKTNRMPKNPSVDERVKWHTEHAKNCSCREMPKKIFEMIKNMEKIDLIPNQKTNYKCKECGFAYRESKWAKKCKGWCRKHHSCNINITKHAIKQN